ncbi:MAG: glycosyltransferase family 4 protein [Acholeplasma sp.]|nr:glycosyltransferase family 4 protein [Acholeplasma sp.]
MSKHILVVSQYYFPENFRINDITKEWIKRGYTVTVITGIPNYPKGQFYKGYGFFRKRKETIDGIKIVRLPIIPRLNNSLFLALNYFSFVISGWLWAKFTRIKADLVFNFEVSPMTQALPAIWFAKRRNIPSYIYVQDLWPENLQIVGGINNKFIIKRVNKMVDKIYEKSTRILVTSDSFKESIITRGVNESKVVVWYQYAEEFYIPSTRDQIDKRNDLKIIFTGNIGQAQGLEILPKIARILKDSKLSALVKFIIVGNGRSKNDLLRDIEESKASEMFQFIDAVPSREIPSILSKADVAFLSFTDNELFSKTIPAKLQSYMACGMPIFAVARGETERIINNSKCGVVTHPSDINAAVEAIRNFLVLDGDKLTEMSTNSLNFSQEHFNKQKLMDYIDYIFMEDNNV